MIYYRRPYPNELYHYGIKGQHWGERRFQNKDGSLTTAGKERYSTMYVTPKSINSRPADFGLHAIARREYKDGSEVQVYTDGTIMMSPQYNVQNYLQPGDEGYEDAAKQFPKEFTDFSYSKAKTAVEKFQNKTLRTVGKIKDAIAKAKNVVDGILRKITGSVKVESNTTKPMYETHRNTGYNLALNKRKR